MITHSPNIIDLSGKRFGRLVAIKISGRNNQGQIKWECVCDCGKTHSSSGSDLRLGKSRSCGCLREEMRVSLRQKNNVQSGQTFGRLVTILLKRHGKAHERTWMCLCLCGNIVEANEHSLIYGGKRSCGCLYEDTRGKNTASITIHGQANKPTGISWYNMMKRCFNPKLKSFKDYGARGIVPCAYIKDSPVNLINAIGERPSGLTLERIDNDKGYTCGTCPECISHGWTKNIRWATRKEQANNRRPSWLWTKRACSQSHT